MVPFIRVPLNFHDVRSEAVSKGRGLRLRQLGFNRTNIIIMALLKEAHSFFRKLSK